MTYEIQRLDRIFYKKVDAEQHADYLRHQAKMYDKKISYILVYQFPVN